MITEYLDKLPEEEKAAGYKLRRSIRQLGQPYLKSLNTRQLKGKLWEIKFSANRIMYITVDSEKIYFLHICKKQKGKAEKKRFRKSDNQSKEKQFKGRLRGKPL